MESGSISHCERRETEDQIFSLHKTQSVVQQQNPQLLQHNGILFISSVFYAYSYEFLMNVTRLSPHGWSLGMRLWISGLSLSLLEVRGQQLNLSMSYIVTPCLWFSSHSRKSRGGRTWLNFTN